MEPNQFLRCLLLFWYYMEDYRKLRQIYRGGFVCNSLRRNFRDF